MLTLELATLSDRGGRKRNEDACGHWSSGRHLCCVLADGAGGHGGGDIASRLVVNELIDRFALRPSRDAEDLGGLVRQVNLALIDQREPGTPRQDMHSTVVCLVVDLAAHRVHWAHAGDSRLYWFRDGRVWARTRDHSLVQALLAAGAITPAQASAHPRRSELRSALGLADDALELSAADGGDPVQPGDAFLLCSDGLWEFAPEHELERTLAAATRPADWLAQIERLVRRNAAARIAHDNFSALAVWSGPAG